MYVFKITIITKDTESLTHIKSTSYKLKGMIKHELNSISKLDK